MTVRKGNRQRRTFSFAVDLARSHGRPPRFLFLFLFLTTLVEVLDDDADEHVEHEEGDEQQERDEVEQTPLVVVHLRLNTAHQAIHVSAVANQTARRNRAVDRARRSILWSSVGARRIINLDNR